MKAKAVVPLLICLALALPARVSAGQYTPRPGAPGAAEEDEGHRGGLGLAFVTYLSGESFLKSEDAEDWMAVSPNLSLRIGDRIWVQDDAKVEVRFPLGATAWVNYQSELDITRMEKGRRADTIQLALVSGEAAFDVKGFGRPGSVFQVDLPNASIRTFRQARFRVNTLPDNTAQIGVIHGSVVLETPEGLTEVQRGQMAELGPDGTVALDYLPESDPWDDWVRARAALYDRPAASSRYLPADLSPYAREFDVSGRWVKDPTYGYVWVPAVDPGWSPYSNGRWIWQANDYVWLSFDPWYAPFHYGRWNWRVSLGWFWIAPRHRAYWSPGYVSWAVIGDDVCWVPLGHNEPYHGYGYHGPNSVNVTRTPNVTLVNVLINSTVKNGVVVVRKDDFLRGRIVKERIAPSRNPFQERDRGGVRVIGRPPVQELRPIRETRQTRPEVEVRHLNRPPARLERESKTIRERVLAPTREHSVFKPGNMPPPLRNIQRQEGMAPAPSPRNVPPAPPVQRQQEGATQVRPSSPALRGGEVPAPPVQRQQGGATQVRPSPPAPRGGEVPAPPGRRQFKRVMEPAGGGAAAPPVRVVPPEQPKEQREKLPPGEPGQRRHGKGNGERD